jgi:cytidine deaminase
LNHLDELPKNIQELMRKAHRGTVQKPMHPIQNFWLARPSNSIMVKSFLETTKKMPHTRLVLCAERTAIFYAHAQFPKEKILRMAISCGI